MKVFLSWSGSKSHDVANAFADWIPTVIQGIQPWLSAKDINKGATWIDSIKQGLGDSQGVGIFFLTQEALSSNWMMFEAGSIASLGHGRVCILYVDVDATDVHPPLSLFQATKFEKEDVLALMRNLNALRNDRIEESILTRSFDRAWEEISRDVERIKNKASDQSGKVRKKSNEQYFIEIAELLQRMEARLNMVELGIKDMGLRNRNLANRNHSNLIENALNYAKVRSDYKNEITAKDAHRLRRERDFISDDPKMDDKLKKEVLSVYDDAIARSIFFTDDSASQLGDEFEIPALRSAEMKIQEQSSKSSKKQK